MSVVMDSCHDNRRDRANRKNAERDGSGMCGLIQSNKITEPIYLISMLVYIKHGEFTSNAC